MLTDRDLYDTPPEPSKYRHVSVDRFDALTAAERALRLVYAAAREANLICERDGLPQLLDAIKKAGKP